MSQATQDPIAVLSSEHEQMMGALAKLDGALRALVVAEEPEELEALAGAFEGLLGLFNGDLARHMGFEENHLFPALERHIGSEHGPLAVMLYEHKVVFRNLARFGEAFSAWRGSWPADGDEAERRRERGLARELAQAAEEFAGALASHAAKEDEVLFPMALRYLSAEEIAAMVEGLAS